MSLVEPQPSDVELPPGMAQQLAANGWRSHAEFCRTFLPDWFPTKMPWFHRGIAALRTGRVDWLLDFGDEWWPKDMERGTPSQWTPHDLAKIISNFVYPVDPRKPNEDLIPLFEADFDDAGNFVAVRIREKMDNYGVALPRGYSKTTLENSLNLADVLYQESPFTLYVSEAAPHAWRQVLTIRRQLENNSLIVAVFGNLRPNRQASEKWSDGFFETTTGQRVGGIGSGGQVRGISIDAIRPSRIVIDDFQNEETVKEPAQRLKDDTWFMATLLPARQLFGDRITKVDFIGTILHKEAVLSTLRTDPEWHVVVFGALDRQGEALWEFALNVDGVAAKRLSFARRGMLEQFELEYMSNAIEDKTVAFPLDRLNIIRREEDWYIAKALVQDPAISDNPNADFCSFAVVGIGSHGRIHIQDFYGQIGMDPADQVEKIFELYFAHLAHLDPDLRKVGIEAVAFQRALLSLVTAKQHEKSRTWGQKAFFEVIPILHGKTVGGKIARVQNLLRPRWKAGHISAEFHFPDLETQLADWPTGKKDGPDVVAMAIRLLDPFAALNQGEEIEDQLPTKAPPVTRLQLLKASRKAP